MNSLIEDNAQLDLFDPQVDAETGNFYFWLGGQGDDVDTNFLSREEFEQLLKDLDGGTTV